jgi:hypothetical protein
MTRRRLSAHRQLPSRLAPRASVKVSRPSCPQNNVNYLMLPVVRAAQAQSRHLGRPRPQVHKLPKAVTALAIGNVGKRQEAEAGGHASDGHGAGGCCDPAHTHQKPRSHGTSRIAWAKLMARVGEEFPLECPICGGDIRLIDFITEPGPIRKILAPVLLHTEWRTARAPVTFTCPRPANRLGRACRG